MGYWVFTSYARPDRDHFLEQFIYDLREEIRRKHIETIPAKNTAFFDTTNIETGSDWEEAIAAALGTSRTFLCLCSPGYFNSDYCGRELQVFSERCETWIRQTGRPAGSARIIFPIVWELPRGVLPPPLARFQWTDDDLPPVYAAEGLRYMMKLNRHRDDYMQFVDRLATKLIAAGTDAQLPEIAGIPPMRDVLNPLHTYMAKRPAIRATGPNSARFAFVAATAQEISGRRASMACYEDESGWFWRPFFPDAPESIGKFAQVAATNLNLRYSELPVNASLVQELEEARRNNEAVIILADPWTVCIADYARLMRAYDNLTLINCGVLIAWNDTDMETTANKTNLERTLRDAFPQKTVLRPPGHEWDSVRSAPDLRLKLEEALTRLRMMIIEMCAPERKAESEELMSRAVDAGIPVSTKPSLWGPGGELTR